MMDRDILMKDAEEIADYLVAAEFPDLPQFKERKERRRKEIVFEEYMRMVTPPRKSQLDRIEQKIDILINRRDI
jgi:hypothetical protein